MYLLDDEAPAGRQQHGGDEPDSSVHDWDGWFFDPLTGGPVADDATLTNPVQLLLESKNKWVYVANYGSNNTGQPGAGERRRGLRGGPDDDQLSFIAGEPFGTGSGPVCIVEDPSNQYIFTANFNDSTVTGRVIDQNAGVLKIAAVGNGTFSLTGPPSWCLISGRTD